MTSQTLSSSEAFSNNNSMFIALIVAIVIHLILVLSISLPKPDAITIERDIDITLIEVPSIKVPEKSQFLAEDNQLAEDETAKNLESQATPPSPLPNPIEPVKQPIVPPVKPNPIINKTLPKPVKPISETKQIIKTPPKPPKVAPEKKQIIKTPELIKPTPVEKPKPVSTIKPITTPEKIEPMFKEQIIPKNLFQADAKPIYQEKPIAKKPVKEVEHKELEDEIEEEDEELEKPKSKKTKDNAEHPHLSAAMLQQQISDVAAASIRQPVSISQKKVKAVHQVSAHKSIAAQYIADWERKVTRIGDMNYPSIASTPGFSATLTMEVGIKADGSIDNMRIIQSSGIPELDEAAKRIVRMGAPYPPLPKALRNELDVLLITRVWRFSDESGSIAQ